MEAYSPEVYISENKIAKRVEELGEQISNDYSGKELIVICVLKGAFAFCSDLIKKINLPLKLEFMQVSSYGDATVSSGECKMLLDLACAVEGKHLLIIEDIVDTGLTINYLKKVLSTRSPASIALATLLYKPDRNIHDAEIKYLGFEIEDKFVIGYGLDYEGRYRELPYVGILNSNQ